MKVRFSEVRGYTWYLNGERLAVGTILSGDPEDGWVELEKNERIVRRTGTVEAINNTTGIVRRAERKRTWMRKS